MNRNLMKTVAAELIGHPEAAKYNSRTMLENPGFGAKEFNAARAALTKADFFALDDAGKPLIDSAAAWKNFSRIAKVAEESGDRFTFEDFTAPIPGQGGRTLLDVAREHGGFAEIFTFDIWRGRYDEMERVWFQLSAFERGSNFRSPDGRAGLIPLDLKRKLLEAEGKAPPEDRLAQAQITFRDLQDMATSEGYFNEVVSRLRQKGDRLRKEYILMVDAYGDTMFDGRASSFSRFGTILGMLQSHGEFLESGDYLRKLSTSPDLLTRAAEHGALPQVFAPGLWEGRLPDMLFLWSNVRDAWKTGAMTAQAFDDAYAVAEGNTYARIFAARPVEGKADLLAPLNAETGEKPVLPLGLRIFWDNFDLINTQIGEKGETLTLEDLRQVSGQKEENCLIAAAKSGHFDKALDVARRDGEALALADYLSRDVHGNTLIGIVAERGQLAEIFTPAAWGGNISGMRALWEHVPAAYREQIDYGQVETALKQAALKRHPGINIRPRPN